MDINDYNNGTNSNRKYLKRLRMQKLQMSLTVHPESIANIARYTGLTDQVVGQMLHELVKQKGAIAVRWYGRKRYCIDDSVIPYNPGEYIRDLPEQQKRHDYLAPAPKPTDSVLINLLMGYTDFIPPEGRHVSDRHASWTGASTPFSNVGSSLEMVA